jgi:YihY family inner membrane protein
MFLKHLFHFNSQSLPDSYPHAHSTRHGIFYLWRLLRETMAIYSRIAGGENAAAFAYYALFSLVPLVALLLTIGSYFFPGDTALTTIHRFVPLGADQQELLWSMVSGLEKARGSVSIVSLLILIWASQRFFHSLVLSINYAWGTRRLLWWQMPVKNLLMILAMSGALLIGTIVPALLQAVARLLHSLEAVINDHLPMLNVDRLLALVDLSRYIGGTLVLFYCFAMLFMLAPRHKIRFKQIWIPAMLVAVLLQVGQACFVNIVPKLVNYSAIYGAMGSMMFLLLWVYVAGTIIIAGGCLCAALAHLSGHAYINHSQIGSHPKPVEHPEP